MLADPVSAADLAFSDEPGGRAPLYTETFGDPEYYQPTVVAVSGVAGSGKSTVAKYLIEQKGFTLVKFAGPLKAMCRAVGMTDAMIEGDQKQEPHALLQGKTPRQFMQWLGTEFGRNLVGENFWTDLWRLEAEKVLAAGGKVVVDDCRFRNEAQTVRRLGGDIYLIHGRGGISGSHASEKIDVDPDTYIENTGTIDELHKWVDRLLTRWV